MQLEHLSRTLRKSALAQRQTLSEDSPLKEKKFVAGSGAFLAAMALVATATPASALAWPVGGNFEIPGTMGGGATWQVDRDGIAHAGDTAEIMTHWLYYPLENYAQGEYIFCGSGDGSDATLTDEVGGDITIDCAAMPGTFVPGLKGTLHVRLYAEEASGYLARVWVELENTSGSTITIGSDDPLGVYYYYNRDAWNNGDPWMTNMGGGDSGRDGAVWGAGGDVNNNEIATSAAWGDPSQWCRFETVNYGMYYPSEANVITAGETVNLISFINMVFPATNDSAGTTEAFEIALTQAQSEFADGLTGRMTDGLPTDIAAIGWETDDACTTKNGTAGAEKLAATGPGMASAVSLAAGAIGLVIAGIGSLLRVHRRNRV